MDADAQKRFALLMGAAGDSVQDTTKKALRVPFGWPGSKARSVKQLLEYVPYDQAYCEPFGGSAALLLAREPSSFEVYNDRYGGIVCFFRAIRDHSDELIDRLNTTVFAREEWELCHEGWEDCTDEVERAAQWFYMTAYSFAQLGRNWGRSLKANGNPAGKIKTRLMDFYDLNRRLASVVIENLDWREILEQYDQEGMVWYLDPPYIQTPLGTYKHNMTEADHCELIRLVRGLKGSAYVSGYHHPIYDDEKWTAVYSWPIRDRMTPMAVGEGNNKTERGERNLDEEVLWVWRQ